MYVPNTLCSPHSTIDLFSIASPLLIIDSLKAHSKSPLNFISEADVFLLKIYELNSQQSLKVDLTSLYEAAAFIALLKKHRQTQSLREQSHRLRFFRRSYVNTADQDYFHGKNTRTLGQRWSEDNHYSRLFTFLQVEETLLCLSFKCKGVKAKRSPQKHDSSKVSQTTSARRRQMMRQKNVKPFTNSEI